MRPQDIVVNEYYRFRSHPNYSYAKAIRIIKPFQHPNTNSYTIIECEHCVNKNDNMVFVRYFRPYDLIKDGSI
jgi:hypothetical protein